jgi:DNA-binding IclR family transcriptional regulator
MAMAMVSVAIRSPSGEWAAISIPASTQRFDAMKFELTRALLKHAGRLQQKMNR